MSSMTTDNIFRPKFVTLGTFKSMAAYIEINCHTIKALNVRLGVNACQMSAETTDIVLSYQDMDEIKYWTNESNSAIIIKPNDESNARIEESLNVSHNGYAFDVSSYDIREQYIIAVLNEHLSSDLIKSMKQWIKFKNRYLNLVELQTTDPLFAWIERCERRALKTRSQTNTNEEMVTDIHDIEDMAEIEVLNEIIIPKIKPQRTKQRIEFSYQPIDLLLGTFECSAKQIIFTLNSIKLIEFKNKIKSEPKPQFSIPFEVINSLFVNTNQTITSLFIKLNDSFNTTAINSHLNCGNNSIKNKFNVSSEDIKESHIIIQFVDQMPKVFNLFLKEMSTFKELNIILKEISNEKTNEMIENTKTQIQLILDSFKVKDMESKVNELKTKNKFLSNENNSLKRKFEDWEQKSENLCAICLEKRVTVLSTKRKIVSTLCGHVFCKPCLETALLMRNVCPSCRHPIDTTQGYIEIHI